MALIRKKTKFMFVVANKINANCKLGNCTGDLVETLAFVLQNMQLQKNSQVAAAV